MLSTSTATPSGTSPGVTEKWWSVPLGSNWVDVSKLEILVAQEYRKDHGDKPLGIPDDAIHYKADDENIIIYYTLEV